MFHERHPLALHRARDERLRHVAGGVELREHSCELVVIVAVARRDVPAEGTQLRLDVAERHDLFGQLVGLQLVAVDDDPEVAERVGGRGLQPLEVLALLELAVAGHHDHPAASSQEPLRPRNAAALGDPHAQRARVRLDARHADVGMPVEPAETS